MASVKERHPTVYVDRNEDTRKRKRTVPMEVLSLSFSRTGTMTMQAAFEILGIPSWHWCTMSENTGDLAMWTEALQAKFQDGKPFGRAEFDNLLGKWGATTEQPVSFLAEDMIEAYPEAKVILVERNVERWYKSFSEVVIKGYGSPLVPLGTMIDRTYLGQMRAQMDLIVEHYFNVREKHTRFGLFNNPEFFNKWRENAKSTYLAHNERIKRITPRDRLLVYELDQGWEPLCRHLGKSIPDQPFPRVNETLAMQEKINLYIAESYKRSLVNFIKRRLPVVVMLLVGLLGWRMI